VWQIVQELKRLLAASFNCSDLATAILDGIGLGLTICKRLAENGSELDRI
jgi:hypothetical protein